MRIIILVSMIWLLSWSNLIAQENESSDPFDVSTSVSKIEELGVITKPEVDGLESEARDLFKTGKYEEAIPVLEEFAKKANWLSNLISANLDPFYSADYDERKEYPYHLIEPLIELEKMANDYKRKRDIALAMQGECLLKIGNEKDAVPVLLKALDLLDLHNDYWWERTRTNLLTIIKVQ